MIVDLIIPAAIAKWALLAPIFIPLFSRLGVAPQTVLAAYRVGDSPTNVITPLMAYFPLIVIFTQRYEKDAGIGTVVSLMLPYVVILVGRLDRCSSSPGTSSGSRSAPVTASTSDKRLPHSPRRSTTSRRPDVAPLRHLIGLPRCSGPPAARDPARCVSDAMGPGRGSAVVNASFGTGSRSTSIPVRAC